MHQAYEFYILGKHYIVIDKKVVIVDEATGRTRANSRWMEAVHQAVEAKERVYQQQRIPREGIDMDKLIEMTPQDSTVASITFQIFFRYYAKLAGMSVRVQTA